MNGLYKVLNKVWAQSAYKGAIPTVLAAAGDEAVNGGYYGPGSFGDSLGPVGDAKISPKGLDREAAAELWRRSEELVGVSWRL